LNRPSLSEVQESLKTAEETGGERVVKHLLTAAACAAVAVFAVQCTDRYWNESDFVKAVAACETVPTVTVEKASDFDSTYQVKGSDLALAAMKSKNDCVKDVLTFFEKTASLRPVITIDKGDYAQ
jgi:hypothetical protein